MYITFTDFYSHNFQDINTFYLQCTLCYHKNTKEINKVKINTQSCSHRFVCTKCGKIFYFSFDQIVLTFILKFYPEHEIVKDIQLKMSNSNTNYSFLVDDLKTLDAVKSKAYDFYCKYVHFLNVLESS